MADTVEDMLAEATAAGTTLVAEGNLAQTATYDAARQELRITLANGTAVSIPIHLIDALRDAPASTRAGVEVAGIGYGLHWPALDLDLSLPALLSDLFGTRRWLDENRARTAGRSRSSAKSTAARANGAKGGRPRKGAAVKSP